MSRNKEIVADLHINITTDTCPMTFVKTKLQLEKMQSGQILEVILNEGEPLKNVPLSCKELGHSILDQYKDNNENVYHLLIKKA